MLFALVCVAPPPVSAAQIAGIRVDARPDGAARVAVTFTGPPPAYRLVPQGSLEVALQFTGTDALPGVPLSTPGTGSVERVRYEPLVGGASSVIIKLAAPVSARVSADSRGVYVDIGGTLPPARTIPVTGAASSKLASGDVVDVVPLKFADLSEIVGVLVAGQSIAPNDTFVPQPSQIGAPSGLSGSFGGAGSGFGGPSFQQTALGGAAGSGQTVSMGQKITDNIAIDRRLNAIVLTGSPAIVAQLRSIIERLDIQLPSVVLETEIVELTDNAAAELGIDYTNGIAGQIGVGQLQLKSGSPPQGTATLQAAIYAVVSKGGGKLLARPRIVAQNGQAASILTGDAIPIVTNITSFASSTTVTQQVNYVTVGVNLQIQPRISSDGFVTSHVFSEVSSVTGYTQGFPQISQRIATTAATVRDGDSFVIGGLVQDTELRSLQKIPGLGDLPLLGGLFRNRNDSDTATNLYIVVTPHIVPLPGSAAAAGLPPAPVPAIRTPPAPAPMVPVPTPLPPGPAATATP